MIDKPVVIGSAGTLITYITQYALPIVSLLTGIATLIYMITKTYWLIKNKGIDTIKKGK